MRSGNFPKLNLKTEEAGALVPLRLQISAASRNVTNPMRNEFDDHY